jgi:hypothetical protein
MPAARRTLDVSWLLRRPPHDHSGNRERQDLKIRARSLAFEDVEKAREIYLLTGGR